MAKRAYADQINSNEKRKYVQMTISCEGVQGQVVFELFNDLAPKTCQNFMSLCAGVQIDETDYSYAGSEVHRIVKGMYL